MTKYRFFLILITTIVFIACNEQEIESKIFSSKGYWKQIGYGNIIELNDSIIRVYDITKQNCDFSFEEEILDFGRIKNITKDTLTIQHGIDNWLFTRIDTLPEFCSNLKNGLKFDPKHNFNVFWNTFNEHYTSFGIKGIDWKKVYQTYEPKISSKTSDLELYTIFNEMITRTY